MRNFELLKERALELCSHIGLTWEERNVLQGEKLYRDKVPMILFPRGVKLMVEEVHCYEDFPDCYFGECQVEYNGDTFVFEVRTKQEGEKLIVEKIDVHTPAGDGKGGLHYLFTKKV